MVAAGSDTVRKSSAAGGGRRVRDASSCRLEGELLISTAAGKA
jgi:hypothetical protein